MTNKQPKSQQPKPKSPSAPEAKIKAKDTSIPRGESEALVGSAGPPPDKPSSPPPTPPKQPQPPRIPSGKSEPVTRDKGRPKRSD
jgi:hypothetical protein